MKDTLGIDFETYSEVDLTKVGTSRYARDPSTEVLMAAYSLNGAEPKQWIPAEGQDMPRELAEALVDPEVEKQAFNAAFELAILLDTLKMPGIDIRQWRCTMVLGMTCSLPGRLEKMGEVVELEPHHLKMAADGKRLMRKFSFPRKPTKTNPATRLYWFNDLAAWEEYLLYNRQDVVAEQAILRRIRQFSPPDHEWEMWHQDQEINRAGVPINLNMVRNAIRVYDDVMAANIAEMQELTGLENPASQPQLLGWLRSMGYPFEDLKKGHIAAAKQRIHDDIERSGNDFAVIYENRDLLRVLELRQEVSRTSVKKYHAFDRATDDDGLLRYTLQFAAAGRTWRWGGRIGQLQNVARPDPQFEKAPEVHAKNVEHLTAPELALIYGRDNLMDLLSSTIRPAIQAPPGYVLLDADLSAIENIVLGWLAGCEKILSVFRENRDPYLSFGSYLFDRPYAELWHEYKVLGDKRVRTTSKPGCLGAGYMLGAGDQVLNHQTGEVEATGLLGYAWNMGIKSFTLEDSQKSIEVFRGTYVEVKDYWYGIDRAVRRCMRTREPVEFGHVRLDMKGPFMRIELPSGRFLHYCRPRLINARTPWGEMRMTPSYEGVNDKKQWTRITSHPGKWTENCFAADTPVLTQRGSVPISEVRDNDLVWDGVEFVAHGGVVARGVRETMEFGGVRVTPEHRVWIEGGWRSADSCEHDDAASSYARHFGCSTRNACGGSMGRERREDHASVSDQSRRDPGRSVSSAGRLEQVYDLMNCGPRNRFVVAAPAGDFLAHNCDQAIARDLLANGIKLARAEGLDVRLHVHDQQVAMIREEQAEEALKVLIECMSSQPDWARDMPLKTAGFVSKIWVKD